MVNEKRVVITGLGALTPIGNDIASYWRSLSEGVSGAAPITNFDASKFKTRFACELKDLNVRNFINVKEAKRMDAFTQYAVIASDQAIADADFGDTVSKDRIGVIWGAGIGGISTFENEVSNFALGDGTPKFNPFFIPKMIADIAPGMISIRHGFRGPNFTTVSACASSANAIIDALNYIRLGYADIVVSGGSEAAITNSGIGGFNALHALSTRNEDYKTASRPFDKDRDGFVMGEGASSMVLEGYAHAKARGAKIYAEIIGVGLSADAYHLTAPHPEGTGAITLMENALKDAQIAHDQVDLINVHGTSTPLGDVAEIKAIKHVFKDHVYKLNINSTKSMTGHLLGAAGAVEALACILAIQNQVVPPTINHQNHDEEIDKQLNLTLNKAQSRKISIAMSNTFGFGGHNACLLFKKMD